jgi:hypothetical protein
MEIEAGAAISTCRERALRSDHPTYGARPGHRDRKDGDDVKYMLLIYQNPSAWESLPEDQRSAVMNAAGRIVEELTRSGELVGGEGLAHVSQTKTIRVRDGVPAVTDGPFVEAKEHLAGYCLIDCENLERAIEIATGWPDARYWAVELRPLMGAGGDEM